VIFGNDKPFEGETRERVVFVWVPMPLDDGRWAWLHRVKLRETATQDWYPGMGFRPMDPTVRGVWSIKSVTLP
jgi:hypothetical protein